MRCILLLLTLLATNVALAEEARLLAKDITGNRLLRLTGAQISIQRGQNLEATFVEVGRTNVVRVRFPSHSHTPHEATIMTVISSCVDWKEPADPYKWHKANCDVIFSANRTSDIYITDFSRWFLVSLDPTNRALGN